MTYFCPAKLNLFLHITGRRADGYHDLQSVFCALDFGDFLDIALVAPSDSTPLVHLTGADTLTDNLVDNLIVKAVHALADRYPSHIRPLAIHLDKRIPTGAGLGGGSSNCATTLLAVNELWGLHLATDDLIKIGATLGADVPFFIFAHAYQSSGAIVEGIGDRLTALDLPACEFLLLLPDAHISTAQLFAKAELNRACPAICHDDLYQMDFYQLPCDIGNVFEPLAVADSPAISTARAYLKTLEPHTHTTARMTGTGAVVFLPLPKVDSTTKTQWLANAPCPALIAKLLGRAEH